MNLLLLVCGYLAFTFYLSAREKRAQANLPDRCKAEILDHSQRQQVRMFVPMIILIGTFAATVKWLADYIPIYFALTAFLLSMAVLVVWVELRGITDLKDSYFPGDYLERKRQITKIRILSILIFFALIGLSSTLSILGTR